MRLAMVLAVIFIIMIIDYRDFIIICQGKRGVRLKSYHFAFI